MKMYMAYLTFTISALVLMKVGGGETSIFINKGILQFHLGIKLIIAFILYAISFVIWTNIVAKNDLGYIVPLTAAITNIFITLIGVFYFKEPSSINKIIGVIIATAGVVLMNLK